MEYGAGNLTVGEGRCPGREPTLEGSRVPVGNPYGRKTWTRRREAASGKRVPRRRPAVSADATAVNASASTASAASASAGGPVLRTAGGRGPMRVAGAVVLGAFLVVAAFQLADIYAGGADSPDVAVLPATVPAAPDAVAATPRDQWHCGEVPYLYQTDSAWAEVSYAGATVAEAGCGPTCLTMVYVALTGGTDYDPATMAAFSEEGGYVEEGKTAWRLMGEGAATLGLASHEVPADESRILAELAEGRLIICSVGPGDFTTSGHFIVLSGATEDGRLVVHDPNSAENSAKLWEAERIIGQARNFWAFERA